MIKLDQASAALCTKTNMGNAAPVANVNRVRKRSYRRLQFSSDAPCPVDSSDINASINRSCPPKQTKFWAQLAHDWNVLLDIGYDYDTSTDMENCEKIEPIPKKVLRVPPKTPHLVATIASTMEIVKCQQTPYVLTHRGRFRDICQEVFQQCHTRVRKFDAEAVLALQFATEAFMADMFSAAAVNAFTQRSMCRILPKDIRQSAHQNGLGGKICPFECTEHRLEAQQTAQRLIDAALANFPTVLIRIIGQYIRQGDQDVLQQLASTAALAVFC